MVLGLNYRQNALNDGQVRKRKRKIKMKKQMSVLGLGLLLGGCVYGGTMNYAGPGTFQDFATARYECSRAASGTSAGGYANSYGGGFASTQTVNCGMMDACMASKGYSRNSNGRFDASSMKVRCSN